MFDWAMNTPLIPAGKHTVTTGTDQNMPEYGVFSEYRITFFFLFSSTTLSFKNDRIYFLKCTKNKCVCFNDAM